MVKDAIENWRRQHHGVLAAWCEDAHKSFNEIVKEVLAGKEISDADFSTLIRVIMLAGNFNQTAFSKITSLTSALISDWQRGYELPEQSMRRLVLELCYASLSTSKAPAALVQMVYVVDVQNPPTPLKEKEDTATYNLVPPTWTLGFDPWIKIAIYSWSKEPDERVIDLSVRSYNCLKAGGVCYLGQLVQKTENELLRANNFGRRSLDEVKETIGCFDARLGMSPELHPELQQFNEELARRDKLKPGWSGEWVDLDTPDEAEDTAA